MTAIFVTQFEPSIFVVHNGEVAHIVNAPRNNMLRADDNFNAYYYGERGALMRRAWFSDTAREEIAQVFGGG